MAMTDGYAAEQASSADGRGMDADLIPWLKRTHNVDVSVSEFPYFQYAGPGDDVEISRWLETYGCDDIWTVPFHIRESATFRTDVVGVRVDSRDVGRRERTVGHLSALISGEGWGSPQPKLRAFLNFRRDGPMTRRYYREDHGLHGEPNSQPPEYRESSVRWLADHGFLTETPGETLTAADIRPHLAAVHAVELKREPREWRTALEQADRADVYADHRWVCMSEATADRALANTERFRERGVGLITVSPSSSHRSSRPSVANAPEVVRKPRRVCS
jgi:hypothetical protein